MKYVGVLLGLLYGSYALYVSVSMDLIYYSEVKKHNDIDVGVLVIRVLSLMFLGMVVKVFIDTHKNHEG